MADRADIDADVMAISEQICAEADHDNAGIPRWGRLQLNIARAIQDAMEAERERCAKIAEDEDGYFWWSGTDKNAAIGQRVCIEVATAIRGDKP